MIGQCGYCGGWHTSPEPCPAVPNNAGASQPLGDWRDAEIERLRRELAEARARECKHDGYRTCRKCGAPMNTDQPTGVE